MVDKKKIMKIFGILIIIFGVFNILIGSGFFFDKGAHNLLILNLVGIYYIISGFGFVGFKRWSLILLQIPFIIVLIVLFFLFVIHFDDISSLIWISSMILIVLFLIIVLFLLRKEFV